MKLICGAGNNDLAAIEDLCAIYSLAGVHCIDVAADAAVAAAARRGMAWAEAQGAATPWLMLSLSDGADPHFRKAHFDPLRCPSDCPRPCQRVCPALAIGKSGGVLAERCYGCGRCLPACPLGLIEEQQVLLSAEAVPALLAAVQPDAVELHTQAGRQQAFAARLTQVQASGVNLKRLAVSCGLERGAQGRSSTNCDTGTGNSSDPLSARELAAELWQRFAVVRQAGLAPLWQLDGRPMSGDVGAGTARAAVQLLRAIRPWAPPGPLQLAGGTNASTAALLGPGDGAAGVAFGGMARSLLQPLLLEAEATGCSLRQHQPLLDQALTLARGLLAPWLAR
ncbi:MAG: Fe-S cluster containing protein [Cyanobacteria bacterium M_surface_10_m2_179]|nr:Fe-S cluster containing protein [Cyanobacteria bacterium M_surface_10_m2_179]